MNASEYRALRSLVSQWRRGWRSGKAAADLEEVLYDIGAKAEGPHLLDADVFGDSIPELHDAAIAEGRALYGGDARLMIERTGKAGTSFDLRRGRFTASVLVRCLNYDSLPERAGEAGQGTVRCDLTRRTS